jgi:hypothetical protein
MNVLVACEYSGVVREAFRAKGHNAVSCDLLPSDIPSEFHFKGDVFNFLKMNRNYDMLIAFPPCTYLTYSGMANWYDPGRAVKRIQAAMFFMRLMELPIERICIENPSGIMQAIFRKPDQIIHPYYFGEPQMKKTCLWLKNLPPLEYSLDNNLFFKKTATNKPPPSHISIRKKTGQIRKRYFTDSFNEKGRLRTSKEKSRTFQSIAAAMAEQWS